MSGEHPSSLSGAFGKPFPEQIAFFRQKLGNRVPTRRWTDLQGEAHDTAFMVAGAAEADLLTDLAAAVDKAISQGRGIEDFRRDFRDIVARNGWTGWTGEGSVKGEAWRVGVIYRTNAYTSYAAGRMAQLKAGNFPFWVYRHGGSQEPRVQHLGWNGLVLPPDHEFWKTRYPPSDWGCSCYVVGARSEAGARRLGGDPGKRLAQGWNRTGVGKGWAYAPGASVANTVNAMAAKVRNWDYAVTKAYLDALPIEHAAAISSSYRQLPTTAADASAFAKAAFADEMPIVDQAVMSFGLPGRDLSQEITGRVGADISKFDFRFRPDGARHIRDVHGDPETEALRGQRAATPADFGLLSRIIEQPDQVRGPVRSEINETLVHLVKTIDGERYTATFAVNRRNRALTLKTMFITARK